MAERPCDLSALCGISNCFRLLFHTQRQIAYALLTRPPLTVFLQFVRLECVRHAASVHPEPGSNSPVIIINRRLRRVYAFYQSAVSCSITFSSFSKFLFGIPCTFTFVFLPSISVLEILLFNFQRSCARSLSGSILPLGASFSILLSHPRFVKRFFYFFSGISEKRKRSSSFSRIG